MVKWIGFGLLCPLVTLLNPYGVNAILATLTVAYGNEAVPYIAEWQPFNAADDPVGEAALLIVMFGLLVSRLRIGWAKALFFVVTLHLFFTHIRFMYLFFLLVPIILAADIAQQYPGLSVRKWASEPARPARAIFRAVFQPGLGWDRCCSGSRCRQLDGRFPSNAKQGNLGQRCARLCQGA